MKKKKDYSPSRELFSKCVKAGTRFYYIDAKQDSSGNYYLVMSESRSNNQSGTRERQRIFVYQEDLEKFVSALTDVATSLSRLVALPDNANTSNEPIASIELPDVEQFLREES